MGIRRLQAGMGATVLLVFLLLIPLPSVAADNQDSGADRYPEAGEGRRAAAEIIRKREELLAEWTRDFVRAGFPRNMIESDLLPYISLCSEAPRLLAKLRSVMLDPSLNREQRVYQVRDLLHERGDLLYRVADSLKGMDKPAGSTDASSKGYAERKEKPDDEWKTRVEQRKQQDAAIREADVYVALFPSARYFDRHVLEHLRAVGKNPGALQAVSEAVKTSDGDPHESLKKMLDLAVSDPDGFERTWNAF